MSALRKSQVGAERRELEQPWAKRLNLGLVAASVAMLATHVMHLDTLTPPAALYGCLSPLSPLSVQLLLHVQLMWCGVHQPRASQHSDTGSWEGRPVRVLRVKRLTGLA